jgi:hypothetical protein
LGLCCSVWGAHAAAKVRGEIRTTVDYLVQLLETDAFKTNKIDTAWLDGIIREKSVSTELDPHVTVACAAIYRAFVQATVRPQRRRTTTRATRARGASVASVFVACLGSNGPSFGGFVRGRGAPQTHSSFSP